ncbi:HlyD family secretion protein [Shewanella waksmanii]|uniref:HlyD family secretion protein n=1 Tax=Shewanella waksmanii TaxID=213783 RepID=UPI00048DD37C|nr:HlyD family efflux transporter periplasmic adaptor subunit [Shewanella waksmanii]
MSGMFRKQAVEAQKNKLHGDISLAQPLSIYTTAFILLSVVTAIALFLSFSSYARKETVRGYIVPDKGVIKAYASRSGNIETLYVKEGDIVASGQALATIVLNRAMVSGAELSENLIDQLEKQISLLLEEQHTNQALKQKELTRLNIAIKDIHRSLTVTEQLEQLEQLLKEKFTLQQRQHNQHETLFTDGFISTLEYQAQQEKFIAVRQELENLQANRVQLQSDLNKASAELELLPHQYKLKQNDVDRRISDLHRQIDETQNNHRYVIKATEAGTVAAIQVVEGELASSNKPLLSIIPQGAVLVAELLLPTRSAGFVKKGDEARLRFDAFPYQRFGFLQSEVVRIDKALLLDGEANVPIALQEPVYRIRTHLSAQSVNAYGDKFPLKSGMLLEADIVLDRRSLLDWLLDPIYSLQGRVG